MSVGGLVRGGFEVDLECYLAEGLVTPWWFVITEGSAHGVMFLSLWWLVGDGICPCSHCWPVTCICGRCGAQGIGSARETVWY